MRWLSTVAVVVLLSTAGCNAFVGADTADRGTVTPAPVPTESSLTPTGPESPPGVTDEHLDNVALLSAAHQQALRNTSYTLQERYDQYGTNTSSVRRAKTITVGSPTQYREELVRMTTDTNGTVTRYEQSTYADGTRWYERRDDGTVEYQSGDIRFSQDKFAARAAFYLNRYGVVSQSSTRVVTRDGSRLYRVRGSGGDISTAEPLEAFTIELLVEPNGFIRQFDVRYRTEDRIAEYRFWYERVGETTVTRPAWLNETAPEN